MDDTNNPGGQAPDPNANPAPADQGGGQSWDQPATPVSDVPVSDVPPAPAPASDQPASEPEPTPAPEPEGTPQPQPSGGTTV